MVASPFLDVAQARRRSPRTGDEWGHPVTRYDLIVEIIPGYRDVICERFYRFSGIVPVREDGLPWSETKAIAA